MKYFHSLHKSIPENLELTPMSAIVDENNWEGNFESFVGR
jgi:hypothetical protein